MVARRFIRRGYDAPVAELQRRLGVPGATAIGVASMLGAGIFFVWAPAAAAAGAGLLLALAIAALLATLNALSTLQLAMLHPVAGGGYAFAARWIGPRTAFAAGTLFLVGKTASVAAIASVAARYLWPDEVLGATGERVLAVGLVVVLATVNATGIRSTATLSAVLAAVAVLGLLTTLGVGLPGIRAGAELPWLGGPLGVAQAASLIFFTFAGYARIATLAGEVREPERTLPRTVIAALGTVLVLAGVTATVLLLALGVDRLAASESPLADLAGDDWRPFVAIAAGVACLGSLLNVLAGLSRTALAMARGGDLPAGLDWVWPRTAAPVASEASIAVVAASATAVLDPTLLVGASACAVLGYYAINHVSAWRVREPERWLPGLVPVLGVVGCVALSLAAPWPAVVGILAVVALAVAVRMLVSRPGSG